MKRLDELITRIDEAELYSGLEGGGLLNEALLTEREAKKVFRRVCEKKRKVSSSPKRKRILIIFAAAVMATLGLTVAATNVWPVLFHWGEEDNLYTSVYQCNWDEKVVENYAECGKISGIEASAGGVTIRVNRLFYSENITVADLDIITPQKGVTFGEWERYWTPGFEDQEVINGYRDTSGSFGNLWLKESDDPSDHILSVWMVYFTEGYQRVGEGYSTDGGFIFRNLNYLDGNGEKHQVEEEWKLEWKLENHLGIVENFENPIIVHESQSIQGYRLSDSSLALNILMTQYDLDADYEGENLYAPILHLRDGSTVNQFLAASHNLVFEIDGMHSYIEISFPSPIRPEDVESIEYGPVSIAVNS